jgi:hypothetical protein
MPRFSHFREYRGVNREGGKSVTTDVEESEC